MIQKESVRTNVPLAYHVQFLITLWISKKTIKAKKKKSKRVISAEMVVQPRLTNPEQTIPTQKKEERKGQSN